MDLQYYLQYIILWVYHNVIHTDATFAIVRILIIIGLVSLLVYQQYILFVLFCVVVICAEYLIQDETASSSSSLKDIFSFETKASRQHRTIDKDELTHGIPLLREGFSFEFPKIIKGDDSGKDYRRLNKYVEEDSRDFTDKYFSSKQCSIGSGVGGITMFGSNELIGDSRTATFNSAIYTVYDFKGNWTANNSTGDSLKRFIYFNDCVHDPIKRNDFRAFKKDIYAKINQSVIDIPKCLARFNIGVLFNTKSDITANGLGKGTTIINGSSNDEKKTNIGAFNVGGTIGDNASEITYASLMKTTNESNRESYIKQREIDVYGKAFGYRKRIDEILKIMRDQATTSMANVSISEDIVKELRVMLAYLAVIQRSNDIIDFEMRTGIRLYDTISTAVTSASSIVTGTLPPITGADDTTSISGDKNIFRIPLDGNDYNTKDEQRYLYGITYYFDKDRSETPYP
jgi:hypothetical protein